ncbi:unnamed protein product [Oikopleura dioica]|uniref:Uncharacterized protein n=1 Tax=Oikopleura dioica TaxID=34765 RepID=E4YLW8_OIKDI|nr:unnamed protein product [Oikopleura dioica]
MRKWCNIFRGKSVVAGIERKCILVPPSTTCTGAQTYNADLSDNGFLELLGEGLYIDRVNIGRGSDETAYDDPSYDGDEIFHNEGDKLRLGCNLGYDNRVGKPFTAAECICETREGACAFKFSNNPDFGCVSHELEQQMPIWAGGNFNFIKKVYPSYFVMKARVSNLLKAETWDFDTVDTKAHPEYLEPTYWQSADFTLFIWCPFDVTKGGFNRNDGKITVPDFYPAQQSADGRLWSFLSRSKTKLYKSPRCIPNAETGDVECTFKSSYYQAFVDRSMDPDEQGPVDINTEIVAGETWTCETGILPGHQKYAITGLMNYYEMFSNGTFEMMPKYFRDPPAHLTDPLPIVQKKKKNRNHL